MLTPTSLWRGLYRVTVGLSFAAICAAMVMTVGDILIRLAATVAEWSVGTRPRWGLFGLVDLTQLAMMAAVPLAIAAAFFTVAHIRVDLFLTQAGRGLRRMSAGVTAVLGLGLIGLCFWTGLAEMRGQFEFTTTSATLGLPYTWYWSPLLLGLALSLLALARMLWGAVRGDTEQDD